MSMGLRTSVLSCRLNTVERNALSDFSSSNKRDRSCGTSSTVTASSSLVDSVNGCDKKGRTGRSNHDKASIRPDETRQIIPVANEKEFEEQCWRNMLQLDGQTEKRIWVRCVKHSGPVFCKVRGFYDRRSTLILIGQHKHLIIINLPPISRRERNNTAGSSEGHGQTRKRAHDGDEIHEENDTNGEEPEAVYRDRDGGEWLFLARAGPAQFFEKHYPVFGLQKCMDTSKWTYLCCPERFNLRCPYQVLLFKRKGLLYHRGEHSHPVDENAIKYWEGEAQSHLNGSPQKVREGIYDMEGWTFLAQVNTEDELAEILFEKLAVRAQKGDDEDVRKYICPRSYCNYRLRWFKRRGEVWERGRHGHGGVKQAIERKKNYWLRTRLTAIGETDNAGGT